MTPKRRGAGGGGQGRAGTINWPTSLAATANQEVLREGT